jgi:DNA helicase-2/ATP-dependent DNA helicase PcrA
MEIDEEKKKILLAEGNVLVIANPGTGKTELIARKFADLISRGISPDEILCLTFTRKAMVEMEDRITGILKETGINLGLSKLNVHTFHSYCNLYLTQEEIIPANYLRYSIFRYLKDNNVLNYEDEYLIETVVPKIENAIRFLKTYGVLPPEVDLDKVKSMLGDYGKSRIITKREMDLFATRFVDIYRNYEESKGKFGIDYPDMILKYLSLERRKKFRYVLIDELQDINSLEAEVALGSGETFFAVGDRKQAIFGFQGGSVRNFERFRTQNTFVLTSNYRSTNQIISYYRTYFRSRTRYSEHSSELDGLRNPNAEDGETPVVVVSTSEESQGIISRLVRKLLKDHRTIGILVRKNSQVGPITSELDRLGVKYRATFSHDSEDPVSNVVSFIKGLLSDSIGDVKAAMLTPFFPMPIREQLSILRKHGRENLEKFLEYCPDFRDMREKLRSMQDVLKLFDTHIGPIAAAHGKAYFINAYALRDTINEAQAFIREPDLPRLVDYIMNSGPPVSTADADSGIFVDTVHGAKGRQFDAVIYLPRSPRENGNFIDEINSKILLAHGINAAEEISEEDLRIDFVALSRAKRELFIVPDPKSTDPGYHISGVSRRISMEPETTAEEALYERYREAYGLFVAGDYGRSREILESREKWLIDMVRDYFSNLKRLSYSAVSDLDYGPYTFFIRDILAVSFESPALERGSKIHAIAEAMCRGEQITIQEEDRPFAENLRKTMESIRRDYPESLGQEITVKVPLKDLSGLDSDLEFKGKIDALFGNGNRYLIVDWKTDKRTDRASHHRTQIELYRKMLSMSQGIRYEDIDTAIAFVALRGPVNTGSSETRLDMTRPNGRTLNSFNELLSRLVSYRNDPESFLADMLEARSDEPLYRALVEEYARERGDSAKTVPAGSGDSLDHYL